MGDEVTDEERAEVRRDVQRKARADYYTHGLDVELQTTQDLIVLERRKVRALREACEGHVHFKPSGATGCVTCIAVLAATKDGPDV
jgi:hypothetical protein